MKNKKQDKDKDNPGSRCGCLLLLSLLLIIVIGQLFLMKMKSKITRAVGGAVKTGEQSSRNNRQPPFKPQAQAEAPASHLHSQALDTDTELLVDLFYPSPIREPTVYSHSGWAIVSEILFRSSLSSSFLLTFFGFPSLVRMRAFRSSVIHKT